MCGETNLPEANNNNGSNDGTVGNVGGDKLHTLATRWGSVNNMSIPGEYSRRKLISIAQQMQDVASSAHH